MVIVAMLATFAVFSVAVLSTLHLLAWLITRTPNPRHSPRQKQYIRNCEESRESLARLGGRR